MLSLFCRPEGRSQLDITGEKKILLRRLQQLNQYERDLYKIQMQEFYKAQLERERLIKEQLESVGANVNLGQFGSTSTGRQEATMMSSAEADFAKEQYAASLGHTTGTRHVFDTPDPCQTGDMQPSIGLSGLDTTPQASASGFDPSMLTAGVHRDFGQELPMKIPKQDFQTSASYQQHSGTIGSDQDASLLLRQPGSAQMFVPGGVSDRGTIGSGTAMMPQVAQGQNVSAIGQQRFQHDVGTPTNVQEVISEERLQQTA